MEKIKKVPNLKYPSLFLMTALILTGISYGMDIKSSLRTPLIFSSTGNHNGRLKSDSFIEALRYKDPWQIARESENQVVPLFVSTEYATTYLIVSNGIEEGDDTITVN